MRGRHWGIVPILGAAACHLDVSTKTNCATDTDCLGGAVCLEQVCTRPDPLRDGGADPQPDGAVQAPADVGAGEGPGGVTIDSSAIPAISSRGNGALDVFAISGGVVDWRTFNDTQGWSGWAPLPRLPAPSSFVGKPAAVSWSSTRIDLFVSGADGTLYHNSYTGVWQSTWEAVASGVNAVSDISSLAVSSWGVNDLNLFYIGNGNNLFRLRFDDVWYPIDTPSGPNLITGDIGAVSWSLNRIHVVGMSNSGDHHINHYWTNNDGGPDGGVVWYGPESLGIPSETLPYPTIASWGANVFDVLTMGDPAGGVFQSVAQRSYRNGWADWTLTGFSTAQDAASHASAVSSKVDRIDLVYPDRHSDGTVTVSHIWSNDSSDWFGPEEL